MSTLAIGRRAVACPAAVTILLALGAAPAPAASRCAAATAMPSSLSRGARAAAVVCEINRVRRQHGLAPVAGERRLTWMAGRFARTMVMRRFFSHVSPGGSTLSSRLRASGYRGRAAGEVLAWGQGRLASPRSTVRSWMNSPPHRRVLLGRNYRDIGVGIALGSPFGDSLRSSATYAANLGASR